MHLHTCQVPCFAHKDYGFQSNPAFHTLSDGLHSSPVKKAVLWEWRRSYLSASRFWNFDGHCWPMVHHYLSGIPCQEGSVVRMTTVLPVCFQILEFRWSLLTNSPSLSVGHALSRRQCCENDVGLTCLSPDFGISLVIADQWSTTICRACIHEFIVVIPETTWRRKKPRTQLSRLLQWNVRVLGDFVWIIS